MVLAAKRAWPWRPLRVGIINIMPKAEVYEPYLLRPLDRAAFAVEPVWIRLRTHRYASSDAERIARSYVEYGQATQGSPLDGLIVTGAPVEELAFDDIHYWEELSEILRDARGEVPSTLGLCWGALALAKLLGFEKKRFEEKLFGVFENSNLLSDHPVMGGADDVFWCAHSRHAGSDDAELERARDDGHVRLLAHGGETGYTIFESADRRFLMHLGHPEYEPVRLAEEWVRDSALGRGDVRAPRHFDPNRPVHVWRSHCNDFFAQWLRVLASAAARERAPRSPVADALGGRHVAVRMQHRWPRR
jgi:homoserine O-succinyltransferase